MDLIEVGLQELTPEREKEIRYLWLPVVLLVSPMLLAALMTHWMAVTCNAIHQEC